MLTNNNNGFKGLKQHVCLSSVIGILLLMGLVFHALSANAAVSKKVLLLLWRGETKVEEGFRDYLKNYRMEYTIVNAQQSTNGHMAWLNKKKETICDFDLVYTWGSSISAITRQFFIDTKANVCSDGRVVPMVFTMVAYPKEVGLIKSFSEKDDFLTGVTHSAPPEAQIHAIEKFLSVKKEKLRFGLMYNLLEENAVAAIDKVAQVLEGDAQVLNFYAVDSVQDPDFKTLFQRIREDKNDIIYIGPDSYLAGQSSVIFEQLKEHPVVIYSVSEYILKNGGALFGLISSYYDVGQLTASQVEQILFSRRSPQQISVQTISGFNFFINMDIANIIKKYPSILLLRQSKILHTQN